MTKKSRPGTKPKREAEHGSRIHACYNGCMLGFTLGVTRFRDYRRSYPVHRQRMLDSLKELGAKVAIPVQHREFAANHGEVWEAVLAELQRISPRYLGWTLFGSSAIDFVVRHAFRRKDASEMRRVAHVVMDRLGVPRNLLTELSRAVRLDKKHTLSFYDVNSAALAMLNAIIQRMRREPQTAFVAMPFSIPAMSGHYASLYSPTLKALDYTPLRAWGGFGTEDYQDLLYTLIDRCGGMLADITTLNANVMHELGYGLGRGRRFVIIVAEEGAQVPANLGDLTVLRYQAKGLDWQPKAASEIAATVALYQYAATIDEKDADALRISGPMKVTR